MNKKSLAKTVLLEGYSPEEILSISKEQIYSFVFCGKPIVFKMGSAEVLGEFSIKKSSLIIELAQIDGGGEGILPTLWRVTHKYAEINGLSQVEWIVHAINCANPNLKLKRILEKKDFKIKKLPKIGNAYYKVNSVKVVKKELKS